MRLIGTLFFLFFAFGFLSSIAFSNDYTKNYQEFIVILEEGNTTGELFYNLGILELERNQLSDALYLLNMAKARLARDTDVTVALARARSRAGIASEAPENILFWFDELHQTIITRVEFGYLALALYLISSGITLISRLRLLRPWRSLLPALWLVTLLTVMIFGASLIAERIYPKVIITGPAPLVSGPGSDYLVLNDVDLDEGFQLEIRGEWMRFQSRDGRQAWVPVEFTRSLEPTPLLNVPDSQAG